MHRIFLTLLLFAVCAYACAFEQVVTCKNQLVVKISSSERVGKFNFIESLSLANKKPIIRGSINVHNTNDSARVFSMKMLEASFNRAPAIRAYKNGVESNVVDFDEVEILAGSIKTYEVVWYPNIEIGTQLNSGEFRCL